MLDHDPANQHFQHLYMQSENELEKYHNGLSYAD